MPSYYRIYSPLRDISKLIQATDYSSDTDNSQGVFFIYENTLENSTLQM